MKRLALLLTVLALAFASTAALADTPCAATGSNILLGGFSCSLGGLTFSGFNSSPTSIGGSPFVSINSATFVNGVITLDFNPNMTAAPQTTNDFNFYFTVTGGLSGIDLLVGSGGSGVAAVNETACKVQFDIANGSTSCLTANLLGSISGVTGEQESLVLFPTTSPVYIAKDIQLTGPSSGNTASLSDVVQSFHVTTTPEPGLLVLFGSGLLGLGPLVRRMKSRR